MIATITKLTPRRGRGPAYVSFEGLEDCSTFDVALIQQIPGLVGAKVDAEIALVDKGDKHYRNLIGIRVITPPPEANAEVRVGLDSQHLLETVQALLPVKTPDDPTPYLLFDRRDDEAIVAKLKGQVLGAYVYHFKQGGQEVFGLGVDGAEACKRELAKRGECIEEEHIKIEKDEAGAAYFIAKASRWTYAGGTRILLDTALGAKRQSKVTPAGAANPFWFEQGCTKAMRNAILRLTPEVIKQQVIDAYKTGAVEVATPVPAVSATEASQALSTLDLPPSGEAAAAPITRARTAFLQQVGRLREAYAKRKPCELAEADRVVQTILGEHGFTQTWEVPNEQFGKIIAALYVGLELPA